MKKIKKQTAEKRAISGHFHYFSALFGVFSGLRLPGVGDLKCLGVFFRISGLEGFFVLSPPRQIVILYSNNEESTSIDSPSDSKLNEFGAES